MLKTGSVYKRLFSPFYVESMIDGDEGKTIVPGDIILVLECDSAGYHLVFYYKEKVYQIKITHYNKGNWELLC